MLNRFQNMKYKRGFGIAEVLVAALVLGFLYLALLNMQKGNREALLRIRGRDGAVEVAQNIMDSLRTVGIAGLTDCVKSDDAEKNCEIKDTLGWDRGRFVGGDKIENNKARIIYTSEVTFSPDAEYTAEAKSQYETVQHVYAKRALVKVSWPFKGSTQSIDIEGVIR